MITMTDLLRQADPEVWQAIAGEARRQQDGLEMIASENYASRAVMAAQGTVLTNKYAEGLPGKLYNVVGYGVRQADERIDFDEVARLAREHKPRLVVAGASAYPREIDFAAFAQVCKDVGALFMVDM